MIKCKCENCSVKEQCLRYSEEITTNTILVSLSTDNQGNCKFYLNKDREQHISDMHFSPQKYKKKKS